MIKKTLLYILTMGFVVVALTACGGKGLDRKLDYSGTALELGESYKKAYDEATPEQPIFLHEQRGVLVLMQELSAGSNDANTAQKYAKEYQRLSKLSVRELLIDRMSSRKNNLSDSIFIAERVQSGKALIAESFNITNVSDQNKINGNVVFRNDLENFDYSFAVDCKIYLAIDGKQIEESFGSCEPGQKVIKSKGGKETFGFSYSINKTETAQVFNDLIQSGQTQRITWKFVPYQSQSYFISNSDKDYYIKAEGEELENYKIAMLKTEANLALLKK